MGRIRHGWLVCDLCSHVDMNSTASCSHRLSTTMSILIPETSWLVNSMRSRLPTLRTDTAHLVTSFFSADEMVVNPVLGIDPLLDVSGPGAAFDFQGHYDRRCFPGTWEQYIADITSNRICRASLVDVLDEGTSWCRKIGHCSDMRWQTQRNWTSWWYIFLQCQEIRQSIIIHYHRLSTCHCAPWLSCIYWWKKIWKDKTLVEK